MGLPLASPASLAGPRANPWGSTKGAAGMGTMMKTQKRALGLAMVNMLIYVVIFTILSGAVMTVSSSRTRLLEEHVRRTKAYYLAEGAAVYAMDQARRSGNAFSGYVFMRPFPIGGHPMIWTTRGDGTAWIYKGANVATSAAATGPSSTFQVNGSVDYFLNW